MTARDPIRLVIVGGGTAGWLSALMIRKYAEADRQPISVTVIDSSKIPTIGVGEGTTAVFRHMLRQLGLDEAEFVRETGATIKLGIRHRDWKRVGHSYDGPIDDPNQVALAAHLSPSDQASAIDIYAVSRGMPVGDTHLFGQLMARDKSPFAKKSDGSFVQAGPFDHAYHFDQAKVGQFLRDKALGIERLDAQVENVERDPENGTITALILDEDRRIEGDFFVDCTGFRRKLIGEAMGAKWVSFADTLPVNRAMPFWLEHDPKTDIAPYTLAWAQKAGWMWAIPTQARVGCGYVYSDVFTTPEGAQAEIEAQLGRSIEPRNDLTFDPGRLDRSWIGNCLGLGLSSSFMEPLEATSIHGTVVQLMLFTQFHLATCVTAKEKVRETFNAAVARQIDDFNAFINLHYAGEREEPFWVAARENSQSDRTKDIIAKFARKMPTRIDFKPFPGALPHIEEQLHYPVLDGLGLLDPKLAKAHLAERPQVRAHARKTVSALLKEYRQAARACVGHQAYLAAIRQVAR
ncbi:MAG: tryptophan 7-halogenase [Rhizobiaceae bacterium]|nr:tryptophan 7-halogenase [Rhizobiaceae bacterium]